MKFELSFRTRGSAAIPGAAKEVSRNSIAAVTAASPVRAPRWTPSADSTRITVGGQPRGAAAAVASAGARVTQIGADCDTRNKEEKTGWAYKSRIYLLIQIEVLLF